MAASGEIIRSVVISGDVTATNSSASVASPIIHVVQFNPASQLPIKLQGNLNFSTWKAQLVMLLNGHQLMGHIDGSKPAPPVNVTQDNLMMPNPRYQVWCSQDELIEQAMTTSVDPTVAPTVATAPSAQKAWNFFTRLTQIRARLAFLACNTKRKILRKPLNPLRNTYKRIALSLSLSL